MWSDFLVMKVHKVLVGNSAYPAENSNYFYIKRIKSQNIAQMTINPSYFYTFENDKGISFNLKDFKFVHKYEKSQ